MAVVVIVFILGRIFIAPRVFASAAHARPAPHVVYARLSGAPFVLTHARGRVLFLDFFATWCEPCRLSLPLVERFARSHPRADVVPVDVGEPAEVAAPFAAHLHLGDVAIDPRELSRGFFGIEGFPTMVVIDPQGRVRATWEGFNPAIALNMAHAEKTFDTKRP